MGAIESIQVGNDEIRAYAAGPAETGTPGVLLLHAWWGLNDDVVTFTDRLAAAGYAVIAPDMFDGRVATTVEDAETLARGADEATVDAIVLAAIDRLIERVGPSAKLAAIGFSFGAHWTMWSPGERDQVVASVLYYGTTDGSVLTEASVPLQGHFAENDAFESNEWVDEFVGKLRAAGREVELHRYAGAGHWFAEPSRDAYRAEAADLAFDRTIDFLGRHLRGTDG